MGQITRSEVLRRATTMWPKGTVPYSQNTIHPSTGYRQDCSGYVSMCWAIPPNENGGWGGQSTVTLVSRGYMKEIKRSELKPGDAVGICGPNTGGDAGHIVLFEKWFNLDPNSSDYYLWEQRGGTKGPVYRRLAYPYGSSSGSWKAYRFRDIIDDPQMGSGDGGARMTELERTSYNADAWGSAMVQLKDPVYVKTAVEGTISVPNEFLKSLTSLHKKIDDLTIALQAYTDDSRR